VQPLWRDARRAFRRAAPGAIGLLILAHTCGECWEAWKQQQIRVINHYQLRPHLKEDRDKLYEITREALHLPAE